MFNDVCESSLEIHLIWLKNDLTSFWGLVVATTAGRSMVEVDVAVVRPKAAVVETHDIVKPVGVPRHPRGFLVRRWAPVVSPVWGAATNRVSRQQQGPCAVIAALLSWSMRGAGNTRRKSCWKMKKKLPFHFLKVKTDKRFFLLSLLPGLNCSDAVDTAWVKSAHAAPLNVTTIVSLKQHSE